MGFNLLLLSKRVNYLGVILNSKLPWGEGKLNDHSTQKVKITYWIYRAMVEPITVSTNRHNAQMVTCYEDGHAGLLYDTL